VTIPVIRQRDQSFGQLHTGVILNYRLLSHGFWVFGVGAPWFIISHRDEEARRFFKKIIPIFRDDCL